MHYLDLDLHQPKVEIRESYPQHQECGYLLAKNALKKDLEKDSHAKAIKLSKKIGKKQIELERKVRSIKDKIQSKTHQELMVQMKLIRDASIEVSALMIREEYKGMCTVHKKKCANLVEDVIRRLDGALEAVNQEIIILEEYLDKVDERIGLLEKSVCQAKAFIRKCISSHI